VHGNPTHAQQLLECPRRHTGEFSGFAKRQLASLKQKHSQLLPQFLGCHAGNVQDFFGYFDRNSLSHD
jgi:hypothetical protein